MASLVKQLSGRKRESAVWQYFKEQAHIGKTKCRVKDAKDKTCGMLIKGKNTTNLKSHLEVYHEPLYKQIKLRDKERTSEQQKLNQNVAGTGIWQFVVLYFVYA
jgi:hypothetical protein